MSDTHQDDLLEKTEEGLLKLTAQGKAAISPWVTDVEANVYAFTAEADSLMVAASGARLSRNRNGAREIIVDEFLNKGERDDELLRRVVSQYGDDSVMQLYPMQLVFERISNIATKEVERGRLAGYLEQSSRYIRFDQKDEQGHYAYYTPEEFDPETKRLYESAHDELFEIYSQLYEKLKQYIIDSSEVPEKDRKGMAWANATHAQALDGVRAILPTSALATVEFVGSAQAVQNMIFNLESHPLPEMNALATRTLEAVRQVAPVFFERTDRPDQGRLISDNRSHTRSASKLVADKVLAPAASARQSGLSVKLVSVDGSEEELIIKILMDSSNEPYDYIHSIVSKMSAEQKQEVIRTYVGERDNRRVKPYRAFEFPHYFFEIQCDYGAFRDIQRSRLIDGLEWQSLHTKLGYITPPVIEKAGLLDQYQKAFALSSQLFATLVERGYKEQAQYATLFGHIMRFSFKANARSLVHTTELRTTPQGHPSYRKVYQQIFELMTKAHPNIAAAMIFVGKEEDPELARLGAERNYQRKLEQKG